MLNTCTAPLPSAELRRFINRLIIIIIVSFSSYRPISYLSFLSKLLERVVGVQPVRLSLAGLLPVHQSAYRRFLSIDTALLKVVQISQRGLMRVTMLCLVSSISPPSLIRWTMMFWSSACRGRMESAQPRLTRFGPIFAIADRQSSTMGSFQTSALSAVASLRAPCSGRCCSCSTLSPLLSLPEWTAVTACSPARLRAFWRDSSRCLMKRQGSSVTGGSMTTSRRSSVMFSTGCLSHSTSSTSSACSSFYHFTEGAAPEYLSDHWRGLISMCRGHCKI